MHPYGFSRPGDPASDDCTPDTAHDHGSLTVGELAGVVDPRHSPDPGIARADARNEQHEPVAVQSRRDGPLGLIRVKGQRDDHVRQHNPSAEG